MMLTKIKGLAVALLMLSVVVLGGVMFARPTTAASQTTDRNNNVAANSLDKGRQNPANAKAKQSDDEEKLHGEWIDDLEVAHFSLIFGPGNSIRRIVANSPSGPGDFGTYSVDWSRTPHHLKVKWRETETEGQTIMEITKDGKLRIESGGASESRPTTFSDEAMLFKKKLKPPPGSTQEERAAERDIAVAEFYRRSTKYASAQFYYELVQHRYPNGCSRC